MPARKTRHRRSQSSRPKLARLSTFPQLTRREARELEARAAADMRSVSSYVALLLIEDLRRRRSQSRWTGLVSPADKRTAYPVGPSLTPAQKRQVQARARDEVRSVSSYVALVIVADLRQS